jgi:pimeloyl-ACP methyl ester carboxylesterase
MTEPYVHASGDGPPAVLVHGTFVGGPQSFAAQAPLAEDHRLLIVDRRGYGANPAQGETLGWPATPGNRSSVGRPASLLSRSP